MTVARGDSQPVLPAFPPRRPDSHKGDYGRALVIGGSRGMAGAIALSGISALRTGAGLVTVATANRCLETVAGFHPSYMTAGLEDDSSGLISTKAFDQLQVLAAAATAVALGPGIGQSDSVRQLVEALYEEVKCVMVVDADALNALANRGIVQEAPFPRILTPHPGEFQRLVGSCTSVERRESMAIELAQNENLTIVLKGHQTLVTSGGAVFRNHTGNPGMATGGSGDVLTGVIVALLCQGLSSWDATCLGVYLHGLAGDLAAEKHGMAGMVSTDICDALPAAIRQYETRGAICA